MDWNQGKTKLGVAAGRAMDRARSLGVPVDDAQRVVDERLQPLLIRKVSAYVIRFIRRTGARVLELEQRRVVCRMPLNGNVNHIGTMYAGALFTLAEFAGGPLMLGTFGMRRFIPIVTELDMKFVKVAKDDVFIELNLTPEEAERIEAETLAEGKAEFVVSGELKSATGDVVAYSRALYQMRPRRR